MYSTPAAPECEGFRTLRTALTLTHQDVHQILITSLESGDGKTTTLANLAVCYAQADKRTLLIDADLRRSGLTNLLNAQGHQRAIRNPPRRKATSNNWPPNTFAPPA